MKIVLHIGGGKCGSSALQKFLSLNPVLPKAGGGKIYYGAIKSDGELLLGQKLTLHANRSPGNYVSSSRLGVIKRARVDYDWDSFKRADVLILSCEGWRLDAEKLLKGDPLKPFRKVDAIYYVRPQVDYINSAYWQWGAWEDRDFPTWFDSVLPNAQWARFAEPWGNAERVNSLSVRLLPKDIVADLLTYVGADMSKIDLSSGQRLNQSLPGSILRILQRHPDLRPGPHASEIDFVLERRLGGSGERPAWVLGKDEIGRVLETCKADNELLLTMLRPEDRQRMLDDPRWWNADRDTPPLETPGVIEAVDPEADRLIAQSFVELVKVDRDLRKALFGRRAIKLGIPTPQTPH